MRYVPLAELVSMMFSEVDGKKSKASLYRSHMRLVRMQSDSRQGYILRNGLRKWSPVKRWLTGKLGKKCWYTEVELVGAPLAIDHFRPVRDYWWLAFAAEN